MMKHILVLSLFVAATSCGIVDHTRCGGAGIIRQLRVPDCEGPMCYMEALIPYPIQWDVSPSIVIASLRLKVTGIYIGFPITIIDVILDNSTVQPGVTYTIRFTLTPYEIICGNTMRVSAELSDVRSGNVEVCVAFQAHVICDGEIPIEEKIIN